MSAEMPSGGKRLAWVVGLVLPPGGLVVALTTQPYERITGLVILALLELGVAIHPGIVVTARLRERRTSASSNARFMDMAIITYGLKCMAAIGVMVTVYLLVPPRYTILPGLISCAIFCVGVLLYE